MTLPWCKSLSEQEKKQPGSESSAQPYAESASSNTGPTCSTSVWRSYPPEDQVSACSPSVAFRLLAYHGVLCGVAGLVATLPLTLLARRTSTRVFAVGLGLGGGLGWGGRLADICLSDLSRYSHLLPQSSRHCWSCPWSQPRNGAVSSSAQK
eukprot:GHVT01079373.1.p1 GENE.GHVT01079373.1~~GHVT01079373.1.p1  ORF type:complete len:152 (+),score=14.36 GHVT01079373.1:491-946(+)